MAYQTKEERQQAACQRQYEQIANGLADFLSREGLRNIDLERGLGLHHTTVAKLLDAKPVSLDFIKLQKLLLLAGFEIVKRD